MQVGQIILRSPEAGQGIFASLAALQPQLVLVFGAIDFFTAPAFVDALYAAFPAARIAGCSTAGEIGREGVEEGGCVVTALRFDSVSLALATTRLVGMDDSLAAGERLGEALLSPGLAAVLVFGPGVQINGSDLVDGIASRIGRELPITGGLAGDGGAFQRTFTIGPDGVCDDAVVAVGLSGTSLSFAHGSFGGWEPFGPARKVTRSAGNVLYELDGEPALEVYKRYLGDYAADLPASGLLFPFEMLGEDHGTLGIIRTILGVDAETGSLTLAGAIDPQGYLRLMHASTDRLVNGAEAAAEAARTMFAVEGDSLAILVSCVGRKLVMGERVDEEVEAVGEVFGQRAMLAGFYSYGEISPFAPGSACRLHNQTMTITWIGERRDEGCTTACNAS